MNKHGFTFIEVLIVVAILGVLFVLILAMNPLEQIQKSKDTSIIVTAEQVYSAFQRSESFNQFPLTTSYSGIQLASNEGQTILHKLEDIKDTKSTFSERKQMNDLYLTYNKVENKLVLCFKLKSEAFNNSYPSVYSSDGNLQENCTNLTCYACLFDERHQQSQIVQQNSSAISSPIPSVSPQPSPTPSTTPSPATGWIRATSGNNCNEFCASQNLSCSDVPMSCPSYCGSTSGFAQIEATWATWVSSTRDPVTNETCWGNWSCSTSFKWEPLYVFNARCCCR